ncbi:zf-TFIIB domain-containing protein [Acinetobacter baumannii]
MPRDDGTADGFPPGCPRCLHTLQPRRRASSDVWACPGCELVRIA